MTRDQIQYELTKAITIINETISMLERDGNDALRLNTLRDRAYHHAEEAGLWDFAKPKMQSVCEKNNMNAARRIGDEVLELFQAAYSKEKYNEELADVIIVCLSAAGFLGIDIEAEVLRKMAINDGRGYKHGQGI